MKNSDNIHEFNMNDSYRRFKNICITYKSYNYL